EALHSAILSAPHADARAIAADRAISSGVRRHRAARPRVAADQLRDLLLFAHVAAAAGGWLLPLLAARMDLDGLAVATGAAVLDRALGVALAGFVAADFGVRLTLRHRRRRL